MYASRISWRQPLIWRRHAVMADPGPLHERPKCGVQLVVFNAALAAPERKLSTLDLAKLFELRMVNPGRPSGRCDPCKKRKIKVSRYYESLCNCRIYSYSFSVTNCDQLAPNASKQDGHVQDTEMQQILTSVMKPCGSSKRYT